MPSHAGHCTEPFTRILIELSQPYLDFTAVMLIAQRNITRK